MVLLTQIDVELPNLRENPQLVLLNDDVQDRINKISASTGLTPMHVLPVMSYVKESCKSPYIDILALRAIKKAVEVSEDWLERQDRKFGKNPSQRVDVQFE